MPTVRLSETIRENAKDMVASKLNGWNTTTKVDGLHEEFTQEALEYFIDKLVDTGRCILGIAAGLTVMKGQEPVTQYEVEQAIKMYKMGLNKVLPQPRPGERSNN